MADGTRSLLRNTIDRPTCWQENKCVVITILAFMLVVIAVGVTLLAVFLVPTKNNVYLYDFIKSDDILAHLITLEQLSNGGSRAITTGYNASAVYIESQLSKLDCDLYRHYFDAVQWIENSPPTLMKLSPVLQYQNTVDFGYLRYGGNGAYNITANVSLVANYGCSEADFNGTSGPTKFAPGDIALIPAGSCDYLTKALAAVQSGARAAIIFNSITTTVLPNTRVRKPGYTKGDPLIQIPVLSGSYALGMSLSQYGESVQLITNTTIAEVTTFNILCATKQGNPNRTIISGSHLDGVLAGPGINDNGSGSAANLEIAIQWYKNKFEAANRIIWAWWGAEEEGLLGSRAYIASLSPTDLNNIAVGLNMDMVGSPNYVPGILLWPTNPNIIPPESSRNGVNTISSLYTQFYNSTLKKPYVGYPMETGSDYYSFLMTGIPTGGTRAGAGDIKSEQIRDVCGGVAYVAFDPCYHQSCDTVSNVNRIAIQDFGQATANVIQQLATNPEIIESFHTNKSYNPISQYFEEE